MDRRSSEECSVPSLSLASSRAKRNIPTKDLYQPAQRLNTREETSYNPRPPIFNKARKQSSVASSFMPDSDLKGSKRNELTKNVYLNQQQYGFDNSPQHSRYANRPLGGLLRNSSSSKQVSDHLNKKLQIKKADVEKALFERKLKKLFDEAAFYQDQMDNYLPGDTHENMLSTLNSLKFEHQEMMKIDYRITY